MLKYLYIVLGSVSLGFGILGFVTPGLPVTPLILLTGFFYAKGSPRLYKKLENHRVTGPYLKRMSGGFSLKARIFSIVFMWVMVSFTAFVVFDNGKMRYIMLTLGVVGTVSQLIFLRKRKVAAVTLDAETDTPS
ncbi:MAG: YbaN family protein [Dysgonomonas sp.]